MKWILFLCGSFICDCLFGQSAHVSRREEISRGGAYSEHFTDAFSFLSNPACLYEKAAGGGGLFVEQKWQLSELNLFQASAVFAGEHVGVGLNIQASGDTDYGESGVMLAYGRSLGRIDLGISFDYLSEKISGYPRHGFLGAGLGLRFHVTRKLISGWSVSIPASGKIGEYFTEKGPQKFQIGLGYELSDELLMSFQIEKQTGLTADVFASLQYRYSAQLLVELGVESNQGSPFFKAGWTKNRLSLLIYCSYQSPLGFAPGLIILWKTKTEKK